MISRHIGTSVVLIIAASFHKLWKGELMSVSLKEQIIKIILNTSVLMIPLISIKKYFSN